MWLWVFGVGEHYQSHMLGKVLRMREWLRTLPSRYEFIIYMDARDTAFAGPLASACEAFNAMGSPIVLSAERGCWPQPAAEWAQRFPEHPSGHRHVNAGVWMAERGAAERALDQLAELRESWDAPAGIASELRQWGNLREDDQFLWQAALAYKLVPAVIDHDCRICANAADQATILDNPYFGFDAQGLYAKHGGSRPAILHFSGESCARCMVQWVGFLGLT